jgi:nucleoid-associated protein YgaU
MPKSLLQRIGDLLGGAEQAAKNKEEAARQAAEAARQEAERLKREAEAKAADLQRQMEEKERQAEAADREAAAEVESRRTYAAEAKATAGAGRTYVVKSGDTLSGIAYDVYGDAGRWPEIFEANRDKIKDPNLIHPGQELRIP